MTFCCIAIPIVAIWEIRCLWATGVSPTYARNSGSRKVLPHCRNGNLPGESQQNMVSRRKQLMENPPSGAVVVCLTSSIWQIVRWFPASKAVSYISCIASSEPRALHFLNLEVRYQILSSSSTIMCGASWMTNRVKASLVYLNHLTVVDVNINLVGS